MKISVGRTVHFYSDAVANKDPARPGYGLNGQGAGPYVATVTQVFPSGPYANLKVIGWGVEAWDEGSVSEGAMSEGTGNQIPDGGRFWVWPPRD